jgi:hypothetical protein
MKPRHFLLLIVGCVAPVAVFGAEQPLWSNTIYGMSSAQVAKLYPKDSTITLLGRVYKIIFKYQDDKLVAVTLSNEIKETSSNRTVKADDVFHSLEKVLTSKYGTRLSQSQPVYMPIDDIMNGPLFLEGSTTWSVNGLTIVLKYDTMLMTITYNMALAQEASKL